MDSFLRSANKLRGKDSESLIASLKEGSAPCSKIGSSEQIYQDSNTSWELSRLRRWFSDRRRELKVEKEQLETTKTVSEKALESIADALIQFYEQLDYEDKTLTSRAQEMMMLEGSISNLLSLYHTKVAALSQQLGNHVDESCKLARHGCTVLGDQIARLSTERTDAVKAAAIREKAVLRRTDQRNRETILKIIARKSHSQHHRSKKGDAAAESCENSNAASENRSSFSCDEDIIAKLRVEIETACRQEEKLMTALNVIESYRLPQIKSSDVRALGEKLIRRVSASQFAKQLSDFNSVDFYSDGRPLKDGGLLSSLVHVPAGLIAFERVFPNIASNEMSRPKKLARSEIPKFQKCREELDDCAESHPLRIEPDTIHRKLRRTDQALYPENLGDFSRVPEDVCPSC